MATIVFFHAHPDDEAIATGGTMARLASEGHRVVLVHGTKGEHGEVDDGFLADGEALAHRRVLETAEAASILGVARNEFLGYLDSGMMGTPENDAPESFWQADVDEAARRLADILDEEDADVLTIYDEHGNYGHPDHIQVHRVGGRAAELAAKAPRVFEATINRDDLAKFMQATTELPEGVEMPEPPVEVDTVEMGMPGELITTTIDIRPWLETKRKAMAAHASQIGETSFFLAMPHELFEQVWGQEWFIRRDVPSTHRETSLVEGL